MERTLEISDDTPAYRQAVEIVERKGVGHPDSICDAVMDRVSVALCREYMKRYGTVLHHNIDKGMLVAGSVDKGFGGGRVVKPMELIVGDRAAYGPGRKRVPVEEVARETAKAWFRENLPGVDPAKDLRIRVVLQPGSEELSAIFKEGRKVLAANDTSAAVGYAPFTPAERAVYETERFINSPAFKLRFPEAGEDVKVMGVRRGGLMSLTIACPLSARLIKGEAAYFGRKREMLSAIRRFVSAFPFSKTSVTLNALDSRGSGAEGVYLTLLGTSAEDADSGQVGRGNRVNGVISLNRPMGTEAAAGKNPVSHTGKIYSVLSHMMAGEIYQRVGGLEEVTVWLLSEIGRPIDDPAQVYVRMIPGQKTARRSIEKGVWAVAGEFLSSIGALTEELARGEHPVC